MPDGYASNISRCIQLNQRKIIGLKSHDNHILRHNLDVMHIEKNVTDYIIGTLLNLNCKTNDNLKARLDLELMGIRRELHPQKTGSNKSYLPPACFTMTPREKDSFLRVLQDIRVPDGYATTSSNSDTGIFAQKRMFSFD